VTFQLYSGACSQCSAPKHLTFNPTFPQIQNLFSREGKGLVILPLLQEICKDKMKGLLCCNSLTGTIYLPKYTTFWPKNVTFLIWFKCRWKENYVFFSWLFRTIISAVSILLLVSDGVWHDVHFKPWKLDQTVYFNKTKCKKNAKFTPHFWYLPFIVDKITWQKCTM